MSQQLDEKQIENLKESLTVLLNTEEFDRIILSQDPGYPHHQWLRKKILDTWQQNKDFYIKDRNGFAEFLKKIIEISTKKS
ncbi:hypothetical protein J7K24_00940 [bacterium]|nr:hypothetical protein [bacterium]